MFLFFFKKDYNLSAFLIENKVHNPEYLKQG